MSTYFELSRRDTKIHCYKRTGYQPCGFRFRFFHKTHGTTSSVRSIIFQNPHLQTDPPTPTHPRSDLVPEFDLSIPTTSDDLGGFVRMPQGAYAHLVMSLDPVVKLGGLPIPDVQLSVRISWHHITGRKEDVQGKRERERVETLTLWRLSPFHLPKGMCEFFGGILVSQELQCCHGY